MSNDQQQGRTEHAVDEEMMEQAMENTEPIMELGSALAEAGVRRAARKAGRTVDEQWERMGDRFEYMGAEQDPNQMQLDDYEISGDSVEVIR